METRPLSKDKRWRMVENRQGEVKPGLLVKENMAMVQMQTYLKVADNTSTKELMCIRVLGGSARDTLTSVTLWLLLLRRQLRRHCEKGRRGQGCDRSQQAWPAS